MLTKTNLAEKMLARADANDLPLDHPMRLTAAAFEIRSADYFADPQRCTMQQFLGCWARARRVWCEYSGEPLV